MAEQMSAGPAYAKHKYAKLLKHDHCQSSSDDMSCWLMKRGHQGLVQSGLLVRVPHKINDLGSKHIKSKAPAEHRNHVM
jgi:hypothetical protein